MKRLGLAREPDSSVGRAVAEAGWTPVPVYLTEMVPTGTAAPLEAADAALVLSPAGAVAARALPAGLPILAAGPGTAAALADRAVSVGAEPNAEALWALLQARFPGGGQFLLIRGERSRGYLESISKGSPWRLVPWITHAEKAKEPLPSLPEIEGLLALSPLQAELMAGATPGVLHFAWGERTAEAFRRMGHPAHDACLATLEALGRMLSRHALTS